MMLQILQTGTWRALLVLFFFQIRFCTRHLHHQDHSSYPTTTTSLASAFVLLPPPPQPRVVQKQQRQGLVLLSLAAEPLQPTQASSRSTSTPTPLPTELSDEQRDFCRGYLNKHHSDLLLKLVEVFSPLGAQLAQANVWSGDSMSLLSAKIAEVNGTELELQVDVKRRDKPDTKEVVTISLDWNAEPIPEKARQYPTSTQQPLLLSNQDSSNENDNEDRFRLLPIDDLVRRLSRLCWIAKLPQVTGKLAILANQLGGTNTSKLPPNMYLNQVPHNRYVRQYFYDHAADAVLDAVRLCSSTNSQGANGPNNRLQLIAQFPELNPSMDSYRIGTLLELTRAIAIRLAEQNLRVRICVQQSLGVGIFTGLPKVLGGVARLLQMMDWQNEVGEENEGMIGNYVNFGAVGAKHVANEIRNAETGEIVQYQDDIFVLVAPQSMVGTDSSILPYLQEMVQAAGDRPVLLINPDLADKVSSAGQQSVRGRQARIDFVQSFSTIYCFQNIYISGTSYFPILGAVTKGSWRDPWIAHQRRDLVDGGGELYVPILLSETRPDGETILQSLER